MIPLLNEGYMKHAVTLTLLFALAGCGIDQQGDAKTIKVAELKGERAGVEKEIELQTSALADIQARLDATHPGERTVWLHSRVRTLIGFANSMQFVNG